MILIPDPYVTVQGGGGSPLDGDISRLEFTKEEIFTQHATPIRRGCNVDPIVCLHKEMAEFQEYAETHSDM